MFAYQQSPSYSYETAAWVRLVSFLSAFLNSGAISIAIVKVVQGAHERQPMSLFRSKILLDSARLHS
jgi:hypothetical protein